MTGDRLLAQAVRHVAFARPRELAAEPPRTRTGILIALAVWVAEMLGKRRVVEADVVRARELLRELVLVERCGRPS